MPPEAMATSTPGVVASKSRAASKLTATAGSMQAIRLEALVSTGSSAPRASREKNPQAMPEMPINTAPSGSGALAPGRTK